MTDEPDALPEQPPIHAPSTAGMELRAGREGAGLSIDVVAQQLKLAPRQVVALEQDDYASLPGRTFVRGFVRNYARFLGLDPDDIVAMLPGSEPLLERPTITPSGRAMGELPASSARRGGIARWAIPVLLVAIVAAAGVYELRRPQEGRRVGEAADRNGSASASVAGTVVNGTASDGKLTAALPNPLAGTAEPAGQDPNAATDTGAATSFTGAPIASLPGAPPAEAAAGTNAFTGPATEAARPSAAGSTAPATTEPLLVLAFKGPAWVQIKDRNGNVLLAQNALAGSTQAVSGPLPLDVVIGNATQVVATFRGQSVDLAPHVRANVARLSLK